MLAAFVILPSFSSACIEHGVAGYASCLDAPCVYGLGPLLRSSGCRLALAGLRKGAGQIVLAIGAALVVAYTLWDRPTLALAACVASLSITRRPGCSRAARGCPILAYRGFFALPIVASR